MTLSPGSHLGPYEIVSAIGAGGMGEVYKARDIRLDRTVAIKVAMLMAVSTDTSGGTFHPGQPSALFPVRLSITAIQGNGYPCDVGKDGRFLIPTAVRTGVPFTGVVNWDAGLKR